MTRHLSEEELQFFAGAQLIPNKGMLEHIESCVSCREQLAAYQLITGTIKAQPAPAFDFDLNAAVLLELQPVKANQSDKKWHAALPAIFIAILVIVTLYIFRKNFINLSAGTSSFFLVISLIACIGIIGFNIMKLYKGYQQQIRKLDFSE